MNSCFIVLRQQCAGSGTNLNIAMIGGLLSIKSLFLARMTLI